MVRVRRKTGWLTVLLSLLFGVSLAVDASTLYRWKDAEGKQHIGTVIPPEFSQLGYEVLDGGTLRVIKVVPPPYTEEQLKQAEQEQAAAEAAKKAKDMRKRADQTLLATYLSIDDLVMARDGQLTTLDSIIDSIRKTKERLEANLDQQIEAAGAYERDGKEIPKTLLDNIDASRTQIADHQAAIEEHQARQEELKKNFARDMERFKELTGTQ